MGKSRKKPTIRLADAADRHRLYELSVQCAKAEVDFVDKTFKKLRGRHASLLREDFCGTANVCCEWVRRRKTNHAIGVDLDGEVLDWGREHQIGALKASQQRRITLLRENVLSVKSGPVDIVSAMNFSYWLFKEREQLKRYFKRVHKQLADEGILFMDAYGGYDSYKEITEEREIEDGDSRFTYVWEQARYSPVSGEMECHIHFKFPDKSRLKRAFSYTWRLWSLPEITEMLAEAGFRNPTVYWEGTDKHGEGNGKFTPDTRGEADAGWIAYIVAEK